MEHKKDFVRIIDEDGQTYYGGNQSWLKSNQMRRVGCGIVAAANVVLYLQGSYEVTKAEFTQMAEKLSKRMPVIPFLGMNGVMVGILLTHYFRKIIPNLRARCRFIPINFYKRIKKQLESGHPVILAIGRNFPILGGKRKLNLYIRNSGKYEKSQEVSAHFVTITDLDDKWVTVSSWGKKYYINRKELTQFAWLRSSWLFTNTVELVETL